MSECLSILLCLATALRSITATSELQDSSSIRIGYANPTIASQRRQAQSNFGLRSPLQEHSFGPLQRLTIPAPLIGSGFISLLQKSQQQGVRIARAANGIIGQSEHRSRSRPTAGGPAKEVLLMLTPFRRRPLAFPQPGIIS
jgi:hypothetical protein